MAKKGSVLTDRKTQIVVALITVIGGLIGAYWHSNKPSPTENKPSPTENKPSPTETQFSGRVIDNNTQRAVTGAKVSVYAPGVPQVYYTDSEGVFYLKLVNSINSVLIRVESSNYQVFERNVSVSRTGIEDVRLMPARIHLTPTPTPRNRPTPCTPERKAQGLC